MGVVFYRALAIFFFGVRLGEVDGDEVGGRDGGRGGRDGTERSAKVMAVRRWKAWLLLRFVRLFIIEIVLMPIPSHVSYESYPRTSRATSSGGPRTVVGLVQSGLRYHVVAAGVAGVVPVFSDSAGFHQ